MITDEQIWNYLDGTLDEASRKGVMLDIENDKEAVELFHEISALHRSLQTETLLSPSALFTDRVMASVAPVQVKLSIRPFLLFIIPSIIAMVGCVWYLISNKIPVALTIPSFSLPAPGHYTTYFVIADIIILAYFMDTFSDYRFNRKTLFS